MTITEAQEGMEARTEKIGIGAARGIGTGRPLAVVMEAGTRTTALGETILLPVVEEKVLSTRPHRGRGPMTHDQGTRHHRPKLILKMLKYVYLYRS